MKKNLSRMLCISLSLLMLAGLSGCGANGRSDNSSANTNTSSTASYNKTTAGSTTNSASTDTGSTNGIYYDTASDAMTAEDYYDGALNTEEYNSITENNFKSVLDYPLSTFSADVDTASYSNIRRMINSGEAVTPDAVRIEEMINYFSYEYAKPTGDVPFSVTTELSDCPWNENTKLLLVGIQAENIDLDERPSSNLVFLLDVSGSMNSEDKLPLMQKAFAMLAENLTENDRISIVTYAGTDQVVLTGARGDETMKIINALEDLSAGGSTAGAAGITTAYELAREYFIEGGNNRVILATDGDLNVGITSEGDLTRLIEDERKSGVYLSVLGFGTGNIKDNKMEALADNGNGNYSYIDSILEAKKVLVEEMGGTLFTVAKDVKFQIEFNPVYLKGYRLIGYENRLLSSEDFNDDTKDAGEIGAGHRVTVLYELVDVNSAQEITSTNLKYQPYTTVSGSAVTSSTVSGSALAATAEWLTVSIRYKEPNEETSNLLSFPVDISSYTSEMPDNLTFASSVAAFGMLLRDSQFKGTATYDMILNNLSTLDLSNDEYKDEFVYLVKKMSRLD